MNNINEIEARNIGLLKVLIKKLQIDYSIEELQQDFTSVYIHEEHVNETLTRLRILGARTIPITSSQVKQTKKTKNIQLYSLKKKYLTKLSTEQIEEIKLNIRIFIELFKELQWIKGIKVTESSFQTERYETCIKSELLFLHE